MTDDKRGFYFMDKLVYKSEKGIAVTTSLLISDKFNKDHKVVLASIRTLIRTAQNKAVNEMFYESVYLNSQNKKQPLYVMNRDGFSLLVMGFTGNKALNFKVDYVNAFNAMEHKLKSLQIPQSFAEALQLAANQAKQLELQAPKVESFDKFINTKTLQGFKEVANLLGMGRNKMLVKLRELKILTSKNIPYQQYLNMGLFEVKESTQNSFNVATTYCTPKGIEYIKSKLI